LQDILQKLDPEKHKDIVPELFDGSGQRRPLEELKKEEMLPLLERVREWLEWMDNSGGANLPSVQDLDAVKDRVQQMPRGASVKPPIDVPPHVDKPPEPNSPDRRPQTGPGSAQPIPPQPPEPSLEEKGDVLRDKLADWWKDSPFANSEAIRNLGRKLSQRIADPGPGADREGLLERLQRLGNYIPFKDLFARGLPKPPPSNALRQTSLASGTGGAQTPEGGTLTPILWIGMAALAVILAWKLLAARRRAVGSDTLSAWRLGPWPVDPALVGTREDLIRAFEYLSLLVLGPAARSWNHRVIATRLGNRPDDLDLDRRRAAEHLATLYERARYAPPADLLPEGEVRDARRDLCLLAGVAHA
jgi:hypothetical protein